MATGQKSSPEQPVGQLTAQEAEQRIDEILGGTMRVSPSFLARIIYHGLELKEPMTLETLKVMLECAKLFDQKQSDYGSRNIAGWPSKELNIFGVAVRLNDKIQRMANLILKQVKGSGPQVEGEKLEDTARDICNYGAILELLITDKWK